MIPNFNKIEFTTTSLEYQDLVWRMPKSNELFLIVKLNGKISSGDFNREKQYFKNHFERVKGFDYYFTTVLLDMSDLSFDSSNLEDFLPDDSIEIARNVGVVLSAIPLIEKEGYHYFQDLKSAISKLSFLNKSLRHDGGGSIVEPRDELSINNAFSEYRTELTTISFDLFEIDGLQSSYYLKISGNYPKGSLGNSEGKLIGCKIRELMRDFSPIGVILDYADLNYEWGDDIEIYPWQLKKIEKPLQFVFRKEQLEYFEFKLKKDETRISFDRDAAIDKLRLLLT